MEEWLLGWSLEEAELCWYKLLALWQSKELWANLICSHTFPTKHLGVGWQLESEQVGSSAHSTNQHATRTNGLGDHPLMPVHGGWWLS